MIYVDTSVVLAHLLAEDRQPEPSLWDGVLLASRLLQYEAWTRLHARGLGDSHGPLLGEITARVAFLELRPEVLERALEPFPTPVRTLDALHLASLDFLSRRGLEVSLATYDERQAAIAAALGFEVFTP